jgi:hypothetical protein
MVFKTMKELKEWLDLCDSAYLSQGGQGRCYKIGNKVYKIFLQYIEDDDDEITPYFKEDILRFSDVKNNTYVFPTDVIMVGDIVVGYITDYVNGKSLYQTNPFNVNLDFFENTLITSVNDIKIISNNGILSFDVMYNILYGKEGLKVIDTLDYSKTDIDSDRLFFMNYDRFCHEIKLFLVYGYFDKVVNDNKILLELYKDKKASIVLFLQEFRKILSEIEERKIETLFDARKSVTLKKIKEADYMRDL